VRIAACAALLAVMGLSSDAVPPPDRHAARDRLAATARAWLWGVNGAASVLASVLAVVIAMIFGISASFWTGVASYVVARDRLAAAGRAGDYALIRIGRSCVAALVPAVGAGNQISARRCLAQVAGVACCPREEKS